jgi:transcriptional regulator with XRE-family HTH domain
MKRRKVADLLGRRIRALRKSKGLTQEQLGAACGVNYKFIGGIERGEENPSLSILQKIAEGLGMEVIELFSFQHEESDPDKLKKMITDIIKDEKSDRLQLILKIINAIK